MSKTSGKRQRVGKAWKATLLLTCLVVALTAGASSAAAKGIVAGRLDPSFGKGGKVTVGFPAEGGGVGAKYELPFQFSAGHLEMARGPGNKVVVAGATKIVRFLANGKLDPSFGGGGSVAVPRPAGKTFVLAGVAVDSLGRILLAGSARPLPTTSTPDPLISSAAVMRFNVEGALDGGFGSGGMVISDLGFAAPKAAGGRYVAPSVGLRSIAVDSLNRPVISGGTVDELPSGCSTTIEATGFVARLTEIGGLDPSFGAGGLRPIENIASFSQLQLTPANGLLAVASGTPACTRTGPRVALTAFDEGGNLDPGFGSTGFRALNLSYAPTVAVAPSGKIALLEEPRRQRVGKKTKRLQGVLMLLPNGAADPGFSRTGGVDIILATSESLAAITVDAKNRVLVAGRISKRVSKKPKNPVRRSTFVLGRLGPEGKFDRSFGKQGTVVTGFGGPTSSFATQVAIDGKGRILVGGGIVAPNLGTGGGFAIARYLGDPQGKKGS